MRRVTNSGGIETGGALCDEPDGDYAVAIFTRTGSLALNVSPIVNIVITQLTFWRR